jgi:glycosyltransferase involved in cell wall biosynthesis
MNASDAIVIPSISSSTWVEQYGRVAPKALACGKLVIASKTGALPELIADAGILVEENNSNALTNILRQLVLKEINPKTLRDAAINRSTALTIGEQAKQM